jgi:spore maturation protein CgeB
MAGVFDNPSSTNIFFAKAFAKAGHDVLEFNYRQVINSLGVESANIALLFKCYETSQDLVVISKGTYIISDIASQIRKLCPVWFWCMDPIITIDQPAIDLAKECTHVSCTGLGVAEFFMARGVKNVHHIFEGVDSDYYHPVEVDPLYATDMSFIGSRGPERDRHVFQIGANAIIRVYGEGYGSLVFGEEFNKICSSSKIMLSINSQNDIQDYFSDRIFLYLAAGGFVMQKYTPGLENWFEFGTHCIWFKDIPEAIALTKEWLPKEEGRKVIAEAGRKYVLDNFTWDHTIKSLLEKL